MKWILPTVLSMLLLGACENANTTHWPNRAIRDSVKNPLVTDPESETIPPDMHLVKDSVIVPDSSVKPGRTP